MWLQLLEFHFLRFKTAHATILQYNLLSCLHLCNVNALLQPGAVASMLQVHGGPLSIRPGDWWPVAFTLPVSAGGLVGLHGYWWAGGEI